MAIKIEQKMLADLESPNQVEANNNVIAPQQNSTSEDFASLKKELDELRNSLKSFNPVTQVSSSDSVAEQVAKAVAEVMKGKSDSEKYGDDGLKYLQETEVDENDFLEKGVAFYTHSSGYIIVDDKRKGRLVSTPFRQPIVFIRHQTHKYGSGKEMRTEHLARYISNSKKEVEWLKNSSFYGWKIFDDMKIARNAHAKLAHFINRNLVSARQMDKTEFIKSAQSIGVEMSTDLENMRLHYAQVMADKDIKREEDSLLLKAKSAFLEENFKPEKSAIANAL